MRISHMGIVHSLFCHAPHHASSLLLVLPLLSLLPAPAVLVCTYVRARVRVCVLQSSFRCASSQQQPPSVNPSGLAFLLVRSHVAASHNGWKRDGPFHRARHHLAWLCVYRTPPMAWCTTFFERIGQACCHNERCACDAVASE